MVATGALAVAAAALALREDGDDTSDEQAGARLIDEQAGSYGGVTMGMRRADVVARLGEPGEGDGFVPLGESFPDVGGPPAVRVWPPGQRTPPTAMRYEGVAFLVSSRGVYAFIVTEDGARTTRGVAVGDALADARRRYRLGCGAGVGREPLFGGDRETYPTCRGTLDERRRIWFGEDPIRSIAVARVGRG